ncbi:MAG: hypothetical protein LBO74_14390 [Candidatus Symbiothrix sp.]|nr:hypothetical protein [Candidatus Symbiothrix sp.]
MNKRMYFMLSLLLVMTTSLKAQVVIGTNAAEPVASAVLDLNSGIDGNLGLLLPRVALESATDEETIKDPATGLMVYADGTGGLAAGIYVWSGSAWTSVPDPVGPTETKKDVVGKDGHLYRPGIGYGTGNGAIECDAGYTWTSADTLTKNVLAVDWLEAFGSIEVRGGVGGNRYYWVRSYDYITTWGSDQNSGWKVGICRSN